VKWTTAIQIPNKWRRCD